MIAAPLVVGTILMPLVIGGIIRMILQAVSHGQTWWRLLFAFFVIRSVSLSLAQQPRPSLTAAPQLFLHLSRRSVQCLSFYPFLGIHCVESVLVFPKQEEELA